MWAGEASLASRLKDKQGVNRSSAEGFAKTTTFISRKNIQVLGSALFVHHRVFTKCEGIQLLRCGLTESVITHHCALELEKNTMCPK